MNLREGGALSTRLIGNSCTHKALEEDLAHQVQGPLPTTPVHSCPEGFGEGRKAEAVATTQYAVPLHASPIWKWDWQTSKLFRASKAPLQ
jgi:hypothetical protein